MNSCKDEGHFGETLSFIAEPPIEQPEPALKDLKISTNVPSVAEIATAIKQLKSGKAAGVDNIPPEFFTLCPQTTAKLLHPVIEFAWQNESIPSE